MTVRILEADDQELIRSALTRLLDLEDDFTVVASVSRGDEVVPAAEAPSPDVALLDIEMPGIDGPAAAAILADRLPTWDPHPHHVRAPRVPAPGHGVGGLRLRGEGCTGRAAG